MDVALVSCLRLPEPDPDAELLAAALAAAGIEAAVLGWDDPAVDWSAARLALLRSCWNYPQHPEAFRRWLHSLAESAPGTALWNPAPVVEWNLHKGYLLELERRGVPITPTALLRRGAAATLAAVAAAQGWGEVVVKPAISAASMRTRRFGAGELDAGETHLRELISEGDVLVQQFLPSVEGHGERALVWVDGELTHAVRKTPRFEGGDESVSPAAVPISAAEAALARRALAAVPWPAALLYARIDVAPGPSGAPVLMELELIEPSLFFRQGPVSLARYVAAVGRQLRAPMGSTRSPRRG